MFVVVFVMLDIWLCIERVDYVLWIIEVMIVFVVKWFVWGLEWRLVMLFMKICFVRDLYLMGGLLFFWGKCGCFCSLWLIVDWVYDEKFILMDVLYIVCLLFFCYFFRLCFFFWVVFKNLRFEGFMLIRLIFVVIRMFNKVGWNECIVYFWDWWELIFSIVMND